jgi:uncharacterized protein YqjF (DUF2071 family)
MRIPVIRGIIDRRILANYRIDPAVMAKLLPRPFRPKLIGGYAIGGICLIRLAQLRPRFAPWPWGLQTENAAHRFAVQWDIDGETREGVYVPRRDTDSRLSAIVGGRLFPGVQHHAQFDVAESGENYSVALRSDDGDTRVAVSGSVARDIPEASVFPSLESASAFFEKGSLGYSATRTPGKYDGIELNCSGWQVQPLTIHTIESSYFEDSALFPVGSVEFDCALLMRGINHEWRGREDMCCG